MVEKYKEREKIAHQGWHYSIQRIDILMISICGASLWLIIETLRYSLGLQIQLANIWVLKLSAILFVVAIIVNFISQFTGKTANFHDMVWCQEKIEAENPPTEEQQKVIFKHDYLAEIYSNCTSILNIASLILMCTGLVILVIYYTITF